MTTQPNHSDDELDEIIQLLFERGYAAGTLGQNGWEAPVREAKAAIQAYVQQEVVRGRIDEAEKIYLAYIPIKTPVAYGVRKRINKHKKQLAALKAKGATHE